MSIPQHPRAVVTGGASGLGRAFCLALARRGAKIVIADRDRVGAEETAHRVLAEGGQAYAVTCDVAQPEQVEGLATAAEERFGGTDLVINNAGVAVAGSVGDIPLHDWQWIVDINLMGVIYGCHVFVPRFKSQGSGHILNVASMAGFLCAPQMSPYNVTKAGVIALSETLHAELRAQRHAVGVTVLCPTFFRTKIMDNGRTASVDPVRDSRVGKLMDSNKVQADEVARIALARCDRNELYALPMREGRWLWRLKRLVPASFSGTFLPRAMRRFDDA